MFAFRKHGLLVVATLVIISAGLFWFACSNDKTTTPTASDTPEVAASKVTAGSCKTTYELQNGMAPDNMDCFEFSYDAEGVLRVRRFNAGFNCCPDSFGVDIDVKDGVITLTEKEYATMPCDCLCLFDLAYTIAGLKPTTYTIRVVEPYVDVPGGDHLLQFQVDFSVTPAGEFCVYRMHYPWGMEFSGTREQ